LSNELTQWLGGGNAVERRYGRELAAIDHTVDVADAKVAGINQVTRRAMFETMQTHLLKKQAELLAPDGAELYAMIAVAGAVTSTEVVQSLNRRWSR